MNKNNLVILFSIIMAVGVQTLVLKEAVKPRVETVVREVVVTPTVASESATVSPVVPTVKPKVPGVIIKK